MEAGADYAVTYEASPPSWETPPPRPKPLEVSQPMAVAGGHDAFMVVGGAAGQSDQLFTDITTYAGGPNPGPRLTLRWRSASTSSTPGAS